LKNDPSKFEIPIFPLSGILLTNALSHKTVKINSQIYLTFNVNRYETFGIFPVVPQLSTPLILGTDWLLENGVNIDYSKKEVFIPSLESIPFKVVVDDNPNSFANSLRSIHITH